jgi:tetratricopeptide (TPR) repeat protein
MPASDNYLHYSIGPWNTPDLEGFFDTVIGGLIRHKPRYLIKTYADLDIDLLRQVTGLDYRLVKIALARFPVYRLAKSRSVAPNPTTLPWQEKMALMEKLTDSDWHAPGIMRDDLLAGRPSQALKECRKLLRLNPEDFHGQNFLGEIYDHMDQHEQSANAFQSAIHLLPDISYTRLNLAKQKILLGSFEEAKTLIREETKRFGKSLEMTFLRGLLHHRSGEHREAAVFLEKFRTQFPERHDCWKFLIDSYSAINDVKSLHRCYHSVEKISLQKDRNWLQTRIVLAISKGQENSQAELATLDHYLQLAPKNFHLLYSKASALEKMKNLQKARQLFRIVAESDTSDSIRAGAWFRLARLAQGQEQKLLARKCLELDPAHSGARTLIINQVSTLRPVQKSLSHSTTNS